MFDKNDDSKNVRFETEQSETDSAIKCHTITDKETGVQYLYSMAGSTGGMTPLLDENGHVIVRK